ncbi:CHAT domain-containing protein, partial [Actinomadura sp. DC4]|uniref:CHAT domain-containing protein n=1 Tax=Actinomadura sp. DC4 TaxID=3055069 RepID=UPI0025B27E2E
MVPRVFISYAHDSDDHQELVREFYAFLRASGVDAKLDLPLAERRRHWPTLMQEQMRVADYVLVIASPEYRRAADGEAAFDERRGVRWEARQLVDELYRSFGEAAERVLPVVLPGRSEADIPGFLSPGAATHYTVREFSVAGAERLLRLLLDQPREVEPPLGPAPDLPPRPYSPASTSPPGGSVGGTVLGTSALRHELMLRVETSGGRLRCETQLSGSVLGVREGAVPHRIVEVWQVLQARLPDAEGRLAEAGDRLRMALLTDETAEHVMTLLRHSPIGTVIDVVIEADDGGIALPFELLRMGGQMLTTRPGVRIRRRLAGIGHGAVEPLPGPLKILVAVAAPDEGATPNAALDVEAEMQAVLDAIADVQDLDTVQVRILEVASSQQITDALRTDQYHVLHLSAHGSPAGVELADEDGLPESVETDDLVAALKAAGRPLPLVVLSACAGAAPASEGRDGLAVALVRQGADRVLAMQTSVSDRYATELARHFYNELAASASIPPGQAVATARYTLQRQWQQAEKPRRGLPEHAIATLLCAGDDPALRHAGTAPVPLGKMTHPPAGGSVRALPMGALIGRRPQLRTIMKALRGGTPAYETFGDIAGVAVTGIGGIGKTALAGRVMHRLTDEGWATAVHEGSWSPPTLIAAVAEALDSHPQHRDAARRLRSERPDTAKISIVADLLEQAKLLLIFDDFEQNLTIDGSRFNDGGFGEIFADLCEKATRGRILVTCRYPVPGGIHLAEVKVPSLSPAELRRMLLRMPAIRNLDSDQRRTLTVTIGGHPRLIEFVNALLSNGRGHLRDVTSRLHKLAEKHGISVTKPRTAGQAIDEAVVLGSRDILLDELLALLNEQQRETLLQTAVTVPPMSLHDLAVAVHGPDPTSDQEADIARAAHRLADLTLLTTVGDEILAHSWVAMALVPHQGDQLSRRHRQALAMRLARLQEGRAGYDDLIDIAHHYAATHQYDDLTDFALGAAEVLAHQVGELSVAAFLGEVTPSVPTDRRGYLLVLERESTALVRTGDLTTATARIQAMVETTRQATAADPSNAESQRDLSISYNKLGDVLRARGDLAGAEERYTAGLRIAERLAAADPSNAESQRDLSVSYNRLGDVLVARGDLAGAEERYTAGLRIAERLAAADPSNAESQRDLSVSYNR